MLPDILSPFRSFTHRRPGRPLDHWVCLSTENISKRLLASMSHSKSSAKSTSALTASSPEQSYSNTAAKTYIPQSLGKAGLHSYIQCLQLQLNKNYGGGEKKKIQCLQQQFNKNYGGKKKKIVGGRRECGTPSLFCSEPHTISKNCLRHPRIITGTHLPSHQAE